MHSGCTAIVQLEVRGLGGGGPECVRLKAAVMAGGPDLPVHDPHAEVELKPQLKPRGSVAKEEDQNLPTSCTPAD